MSRRQNPFHSDTVLNVANVFVYKWGRECMNYITVNDSKWLYNSVYEYVMYGKCNKDVLA